MRLYFLSNQEVHHGLSRPSYKSNNIVYCEGEGDFNLISGRCGRRNVCRGKKKRKSLILNQVNFILQKAGPGSLGLLSAEMKAGFYYTCVKR